MKWYEHPKKVSIAGALLVYRPGHSKIILLAVAIIVNDNTHQEKEISVCCIETGSS